MAQKYYIKEYTRYSNHRIFPKGTTKQNATKTAQTLRSLNKNNRYRVFKDR